MEAGNAHIDRRRLAELQAEIRRLLDVSPSRGLRAQTINRFKRLVRESRRP